MSNAGAKRLVVTGATGYIGRSLLAHVRHNLLGQLLPIALVRPSSDIISLQRLLDHPCAEPSVVAVDFGNPTAVESAVRDADIIVHLAAEMDFFPRDEDGLILRNVALAKSLLSACEHEVARPDRKNRPIRFVYVSSTEAIGPTDGETAATETAPLHPASAYARSKVESERLFHDIQDKRLQAVIARPTGVFGPGERFFFFEFMEMCASGLTIIGPSPLHGRTIFSHVDDIVQGLMICATHPDARGVYNVCADESASYLEMIQTLTKSLAYPGPKIFLPLSVGKIMISAIAPVMNFNKKRKFIYHARTLAETVQNRVYSNAKLRQLGFRPKYTVLDGARQTLEFEVRAGSIRKAIIPSAIQRCLEIVSVVVFGISRVLMVRTRHPRPK